MKESFKLVCVMMGVCLVSAVLVAAVHKVTEKPIEASKLRQQQLAITAVLPDGATGIEERTVVVSWSDRSMTTNVYWKTDRGYAMEMTAMNGYSGKIRLMLGFTLDGLFWSYKVLEHAETPGLGSHIMDSFLDNVRERPAFGTDWRTTKDGGAILPITAATISSRAVCGVIARGVAVLEAILEADD